MAERKKKKKNEAQISTRAFPLESPSKNDLWLKWLKTTSFRLSELQSWTGKMNDKKWWENLNKKRELRSNKNVNNYECLLKRMLYLAGNGQELLSALGVTLVCHASNVFSGSKSAIIDASSKSMAWLLDQVWLAILEALAAVLVFLKCSFFRVLKALLVSPM